MKSGALRSARQEPAYINIMRDGTQDRDGSNDIPKQA